MVKRALRFLPTVTRSEGRITPQTVGASATKERSTQDGFVGSPAWAYQLGAQPAPVRMSWRLVIQ